jgi:hypothetical protein
VPSSLANTQSTTTPTTTTSIFNQAHQPDDPSLSSSSLLSWMGKAVATTAITMSLWGAPLPMVQVMDQTWTDASHTNPLSTMYVASAKEMASGTGSRVNKDAESLLRLGLPIQNKEVRKFGFKFFIQDDSCSGILLDEPISIFSYVYGCRDWSTVLTGSKSARSPRDYKV